MTQGKTDKRSEKLQHNVNPASGFAKGVKQSLHGRFSSRAILSVIIFGMIIAVFVISDFTGQQTGPMTPGSVASVNGKLITLRDFQRKYNQMTQMFGGMEFSPEQQRNFEQNVVNSMISQEVIFQAAQKEGIFASNAALKSKILEIPQFSENGVFKTETYKALLQANQWSVVEFENNLRQDIINEKVRSLFDITYKVNDLEENLKKELKSTKIKIDFVRLAKNTFDSAQFVKDSEVDAKLADEAFKKRVQDAYNLRKSEFEKPDQIKASHILIKTDSTGEAEVKAAEAKAQAILARAQKEDFAKLAKEVSDDPGSKERGGDLGLFARGAMVKEFEETAFALPIGKVSGLVKSQFGFHIIKVSEKKPGLKTPEAEAFKKVGRSLLAEDKVPAVKAQLETKLAALTPETGLSELNQELTQLGLKWESAAAFDLSQDTIPGVGFTNVFNEAVQLSAQKPFVNKLIEDGENFYLLKFVEAKIEAPVANANEPNLDAMMGGAGRQSMQGLEQWAGAYRSKASVEINLPSAVR